ncbi:hypothetical protein Nepgr_023995 [Nepenthes gracilis]|uniref:Auxin-responsive protein n=1 Tax=Nepenthes gracilis TaxID=150966 RepID=A0AAD3XY76_NEPGR|nr:hypothetical protein Nepgr_023995 [Nepenthes gracilis]
MEEPSKKEELCPNLLDLIPKDIECVFNIDGDKQRSHGSSDEKKLELRLSPPGDDHRWSTIHNPKIQRDESLPSLWYHYSTTQSNFSNQHQQKQQPPPPKFSFLQYQKGPAVAMESSQPCSRRMVDLRNAEKKAFAINPANNTAAANSSQKRAAAAAPPVVGWPPIRSFRKNIASSCSLGKSSLGPQCTITSEIANGKPGKNLRKGLLVKINMEAVPIGRKIDLNAYDNYERLSAAIDELFRGLLAAQRDSSAGGNKEKPEEKTVITGLCDGSGEYTLVYEDHEGDRMLVGDVPWHMFVPNVKRLRVLKTSKLFTLNLDVVKVRSRVGLYDPLKIFSVGGLLTGDVSLFQKILAALITGAIAITIANPTDLVKV